MYKNNLLQGIQIYHAKNILSFPIKRTKILYAATRYVLKITDNCSLSNTTFGDVNRLYQVFYTN